MQLRTLSEDKILPDKVLTYLKHLMSQDQVNIDDILTLFKHMYGKISSSKLHTQKDGIFDIYEYFSPKVDNKEQLMNYVIHMSNHPSWIAMLVIYSNDLGEDFADRNYGFHNTSIFKNVLMSLLQREWGALSIFIDKFLNSNMDHIEKLSESNPEIITELGAMLDMMGEDFRYNVEDFDNPYGLESLEQKYGSILPRK